MSAHRVRIAFLLATVVLGTAGRNRVPEIDLHDPSVPIEARRWLADAEDEVGIARAGRVDAQRDLRAAQDELASTSRRVEQANLPDAAAFLERYTALAAARVALAQAAHTRAQARLDHAQARLELTRAEVAIRADLAVVDTTALVAAVDTTRAQVASTQAAEEQQRAVLEQASDALWGAYAELLAAGDAANAVWGAVLLEE